MPFTPSLSHTHADAQSDDVHWMSKCMLEIVRMRERGRVRGKARAELHPKAEGTGS